MTSKIVLIVEFSIKAGKLRAFQEAASALRASVERNEPGTLQYDWWLSDDGTRDINVEVFEDSDALVQHMANVDSLLTDLVAAADVARVDVLGQISAEGRSAIEASATGFFRHLGGVAR